MYMSSPVEGDGLIYGLSAKRRASLSRWTRRRRHEVGERRREGEQAVVLLAPGHVLFLTNTARSWWFGRTAAGFQEEKRYDISETETWTTPVFLGGAMLVRDAANLIRLEPK
jgi:hypothetical protein